MDILAEAAAAAPVDWNALAAIVPPNHALTGHWHLDPAQLPGHSAPTIFLADVGRGLGGYAILGPGSSVTAVGDMNGDGLPEVVAGQVDRFVDVTWGKATGSPVTQPDLAAGRGGFLIRPETDPAGLGWDVSGLADMDGDGIPDLLLSAHLDSAVGYASGGAYVVWGKADGAAVGLADVAAGRGGFKITGEAQQELAGISLAGTGDMDGDGRPDILLGAWQGGSNGAFSGSAYVVFGKADGAQVSLEDVAAGQGGFRMDGVTIGGFSGFDVAAARDMNGDGKAELLVGAPDDGPGGLGLGQVFVVRGKADTAHVSLEQVMKAQQGGYAIETEQLRDGLGRAIAEVGDVNGDGIPDILVGAYGNGGHNTGAAYLTWGRADDATVKLADVAQGTGGFKVGGAQENDHLGTTVGAAGDLNGDGVPDLLVGALDSGPDFQEDRSSVYVIWGKRDGAAVDIDDVAAGHGGFRIALPQAPFLPGFQVGSIGDLNGDGVREVLICSSHQTSWVVLSRPDWIGAT